MDVELMTLGFLISGPKTGYRLKNIAGKMMLFYNISLNQIYPTLRKLEDAGYVTKEVVIQTGKPNKHLYHVTDKGKEYFKKRLTGPPTPMEYNLDFLVKSFFFRFLDKNLIIDQFTKEIASLEEQLEDLSEMRENVEKHADENGRFAYETAVRLVRTLRDCYQEEMEKRIANLKQKEGRE